MSAPKLTEVQRARRNEAARERRRIRRRAEVDTIIAEYHRVKARTAAILGGPREPTETEIQARVVSVVGRLATLRRIANREQLGAADALGALEDARIIAYVPELGYWVLTPAGRAALKGGEKGGES